MTSAQIVYVHGVNTRDLGDGEYSQWVAARTDRIKRLAFGMDAEVSSPYWGKHGFTGDHLASMPGAYGSKVPLGTGDTGISEAKTELLALKSDFPAVVSTLSASAIQAASAMDEKSRRRIEDWWMAAVYFAELQPKPVWLGACTSADEVIDRLKQEVEVVQQMQALGGNWLTNIADFKLNDFVADSIREKGGRELAGFLGDAMMFFSRREKSELVRNDIAGSIVSAALKARQAEQKLVVIGHSMGGAVLHEVLSDPQTLQFIERSLGSPLKLDLFLSVGTQIGLFAELAQFPKLAQDQALGIEVDHYWNIIDHNDLLAFLCGPVIPSAKDFAINTMGGVWKSHSSYFSNAQFFLRLKIRLREAGFVP